MILAALLLAAPQAAIAAEPDYEEVVVTATARRVALVFDKAPDGRLINCRVFKSSGVDRIDAKACTSLPDCVTSTRGQQFCGGEGKSGLTAVVPKPAEPKFGLGVKLTPDPPKVPAVGPAVATTAEEDPNRLSKLPPPPKDQSSEPAIRFGGMKQEEPK